jgi:hypothetical protein
MNINYTVINCELIKKKGFMKSYDEYFTEEKVQELKSKVVEFFNFQSEENGSTNLLDKHRGCAQQAKGLFIEEYLSKNPDLTPLWGAAENVDLKAIARAKTKITSEQYLDTLATNLLFNLKACNFLKAEFIFTKTELAQVDVFKVKTLGNLFIWYEELTQEGFSDEFFLSLVENNNCINKLFFTCSYAFLHKGVPDRIVEAVLDNIRDLNALITVQRYDNSGFAYDEQVSCLGKLLQYDRQELAESLISKGAYLSLPEVVDLMYHYIPDEFLIGSFKNMPGFKDLCTNGKMIINERPLIREVIFKERYDLLKYLVDNKIDVNISWKEGNNTYTPFNFTRNIELFEILVNSGRLVKTEEPGVVLSEAGWRLESDRCYDFIIWRNNFLGSVLKNCKSLSDWVEKDQVHFVNNLFKAFNKIPCISEIKYFAKDEAWYFTPTRALQDKYGKEIIEQNSGSLPEEIFAYFKDNWHKSMLICKEFSKGAIFAIPELKNHIGYFLMDAFKAGELLNLEQILKQDSEQLDAAGRVEVIEDN